MMRARTPVKLYFCTPDSKGHRMVTCRQLLCFYIFQAFGTGSSAVCWRSTPSGQWAGLGGKAAVCQYLS